MNPSIWSPLGITPAMLAGTAMAWLTAAVWAGPSGKLVALARVFVPTGGVPMTRGVVVPTAPAGQS